MYIILCRIEDPKNVSAVKCVQMVSGSFSRATEEFQRTGFALTVAKGG